MTESQEAAEDQASPIETEVVSQEESVEESSGETTPSAEAEALKFKDLYLRSQADFDNFRKRTSRDKEDAIRYANMSLLERLLPILDNFELGLDAARQGGDPGGIIQGMSMVQKQLQDFLQESGIEVLQAEGAVFDPNLHEAVGQEAHPSVPDGTVLRQLRRGFKLRDRLLRPATVIVSKGPQ